MIQRNFVVKLVFISQSSNQLAAAKFSVLMDLDERIVAFGKLGRNIQQMPDAEYQDLAKRAGNENAWFTPENITLALSGIEKFLKEDALTRWTSQYFLEQTMPKTVGVAMAGNIPLVGFHDYLSVLISGHRIQIKLSSQDQVLLPYLNNLLIDIEPRFRPFISFVERLKGYDLAIATGSNNTARYFNYYFKKVPHLIRKNRSSCAILMGEEPEREMDSLGSDLFTYFGLGCRNVSKLYVHKDYDFIPLLRTWEKYLPLRDHNKYTNNYEYQRTIHLINQKHFFDNGVVLLMEDERLVSPIATVYYEKYANQEDLKVRLEKHRDKIQCIVSAGGWFKGSIPFGKTQQPELWDYADCVDTLKFLSTS